MLLVIFPGSPTLLPALPPHIHTENALGSEFQMYKIQSRLSDNEHIILPFQELEKFKLEILTTTP